MEWDLATQCEIAEITTIRIEGRGCAHWWEGLHISSEEASLGVAQVIQEIIMGRNHRVRFGSESFKLRYPTNRIYIGEKFEFGSASIVKIPRCLDYVIHDSGSVSILGSQNHGAFWRTSPFKGHQFKGNHSGGDVTPCHSGWSKWWITFIVCKLCLCYWRYLFFIQQSSRHKRLMMTRCRRWYIYKYKLVEMATFFENRRRVPQINGEIDGSHINILAP